MAQQSLLIFTNKHIYDMTFSGTYESLNTDVLNINPLTFEVDYRVDCLSILILVTVSSYSWSQIFSTSNQK